MKRSLLLCIILCGMTMSLFAQSRLAVWLKSDDIQISDEVHKLSSRGIEIYHYTNDYILAGIDSQVKQGFELISNPRSDERLYLISKDQAYDLQALTENGRILRDLDSDILYASPFSETHLLPLLKINLLPLRLEPMVIPTRQM